MFRVTHDDCDICRQEELVAAKLRGNVSYDRRYNLTPKGNEEVAVSSTIIREADRVVQREIAERETAWLVAQKIALLDGFGDDNFAEHAVIRYAKQFAEGDATVYMYSAIKVGDLWYSSGNSGTERTWSQLVTFLIEGPVPTGMIEVFGAPTVYPVPVPESESVNVVVVKDEDLF